jgi:hypothetical protein
MDITLLKNQYSLWNKYAFKNDFRDFLFKFYNNFLGLNTRVSHFVQNFSRNCTFCTLKNTANDETFSHFFFTCETTAAIREKFYNEFFSDLGRDPDTNRKFWFGFAPDTIKGKKLASIAALLIQYGVWKFKLKKNYRHTRQQGLSFYTILKSFL